MVNSYSILYRSELDLNDIGNNEEWDLFISAFNNSERVTSVFAAANAHEKHWLIHNEYGFRPEDYPNADVVFKSPEIHEAEYLNEYLHIVSESTTPATKICIDITGFMRPHLLLLLRMLHERPFPAVDFIYTDPIKYVNEENTVFTDGPVVEVRQTCRL